MPGFTIRAGSVDDTDAIRRILTESWGSTLIIEAGRHYQADRLPSFVAEASGQIVGAVTYSIETPDCVVVSLEAIKRHIGIGTALLDAVEAEARAAGSRRMWLTTTNDNLDALRFYQRRGWEICALHRNSLEKARQHKPIPAIGVYGIPLRDEIELERLLAD